MASGAKRKGVILTTMCNEHALVWIMDRRLTTEDSKDTQKIIFFLWRLPARADSHTRQRECE